MALRQAACVDPGREMPEAVLKLAACVDPGREMPEAVLKLAACVDSGSRHPKTVQRLAMFVGTVHKKVPETHQLQRKMYLRTEFRRHQGDFRLQVRIKPQGCL